MQVAGAAVVAEPLPQLQHVLLVGGGEVGERREGGEEPLEVRDDGGDRGLLEHDLADPDAVRVAVGPPGQVAAVAVEPGEQGFAEGGEGAGRPPGRRGELGHRRLRINRESQVSKCRKSQSRNPRTSAT